MKRILTPLLSLFLLLPLVSCGTPKATTPVSSESGTAQSEPGTPNPSVSEAAETAPVRIRLRANGATATVLLLENDAVTDFLSMLPVTLTFEDYNGIEKIATLPRALQTGGTLTSCDPNVGTFAYYAPWGNLSVFYQDFRESNGLVPLGTFESGLEAFAEFDGEFTVTIELEEHR